METKDVGVGSSGLIQIARSTLLDDKAGVTTVQQAIREKYGFEVTPAYARDFIAFVQELTGVERG